MLAATSGRAFGSWQPGDKRSRSDQTVSFRDHALNLFPVDLRQIKPETKPATSPDVFGNEKAFRSGMGESFIHAGSGLTIQSHPAVAVMIVKKVTELFAADFETQVAIAPRNSERVWQGFDKSDHMPATPFEQRPGYL